MATLGDLPASGEQSIRCHNNGVLPPAKINGRPVGTPGTVDAATATQCCAECRRALFFGGTHPHLLDAAQTPEPLASFVRVHLNTPRRHASLAAPRDSNWLFPGHLPGQPITPSRLGQRLGQLGIDAQAAHRAAMLQLASSVPAAVLADLLGIHTTTAADWAHAAGGEWSHYAAEIARDQARSTDKAIR